jgi:hypothetical protein
VLYQLSYISQLRFARNLTTQNLERETGIEPATNSLEGCDSTTELLPHCLAVLLARTLTLGLIFQQGPPLMDPCPKCEQNQHRQGYAANTEIKQWLPVWAVNHLDRLTAQRHPLQHAEYDEDAHGYDKTLLSHQGRFTPPSREQLLQRERLLVRAYEGFLTGAQGWIRTTELQKEDRFTVCWL